MNSWCYGHTFLIMLRLYWQYSLWRVVVEWNFVWCCWLKQCLVLLCFLICTTKLLLGCLRVPYTNLAMLIPNLKSEFCRHVTMLWNSILHILRNFSIRCWLLDHYVAVPLQLTNMLACIILLLITIACYFFTAMFKIYIYK